MSSGAPVSASLTGKAACAGPGGWEQARILPVRPTSQLPVGEAAPLPQRIEVFA